MVHNTLSSIHFLRIPLNFHNNPLHLWNFLCTAEKCIPFPYVMSCVQHMKSMKPKKSRCSWPKISESQLLRHHWYHLLYIPLYWTFKMLGWYGSGWCWYRNIVWVVMVWLTRCWLAVHVSMVIVIMRKNINFINVVLLLLSLFLALIGTRMRTDTQSYNKAKYTHTHTPYINVYAHV